MRILGIGALVAGGLAIAVAALVAAILLTAVVLARLERARLRSRDRSARARLLGDCAANAVPRRRLVPEARDHRDRLPRRSLLVARRCPGALAFTHVPQLRRSRAAR